ncbi:MAG: preprotein translocase subunit SecG [Chitinophagaceae bacterium]
MLILFVILIIIAAFVLGLIVLIQNPKGGGLSSSFGGFSTQLMGVKQTTDVLEKGTWVFAAIIAVLCLTSTFFIKGGSSVTAGEQPRNNPTGASVPAGQPPVPNPNTSTTIPK